MSNNREGIHELMLDGHELAGMQAALDKQLGQYDGDANRVFEELGQFGLADIVADVAPQTFVGLVGVRDALDERPGVAVLHDTQVNKLAPELGKLTAISLSTVFGQPTRTDRRSSQIAWPVRYDPGVQGQTTFSQTKGEAAMHTDSAFANEPEEYFGLWCVESDQYPKGTNRFVHVSQVIGSMAMTEDSEVVDALWTRFPFRAPAAFVDVGKEEVVEVAWAPIIDEKGQVRYRHDTILQALNLPDYEISGLQQEALGAMERHLRLVQPFEYHLEPGQAVLVNNRTTLHERTEFDNPDRLLYRVRMTTAA